MPWKECRKMDEKLRFVARYVEGEKIAMLCREFGISRFTGHNIINRYRDCGTEAFTDRSRRPYKLAKKLPFQVESLIVQIKQEWPTWGAPKIRERLARQYPDIRPPAISTVHAALVRHQLVEHPAKRRPRAKGTALTLAHEPNQLWCADYKGEFMMGNRQYCYPLTVSDFVTRFLLACEGQESTRQKYAFTVFEHIFREYGLPERIRSDNGVPFASAHAIHGEGCGSFRPRKSVWKRRLARLSEIPQS